ncbi:MAG: hypothetical protein EWM72_02033 [Nitrospira sp.]|nr:MAG: hypothetical protein EWM72_02033 [Nitrospira sp.]
MGVAAIFDRVQGALENLGADCPMEEVGGLCPELTWNQVFLAIDHLSRTGQIRVTLDPGRTYRVQAYHAVAGEASHVSPAP